MKIVKHITVGVSIAAGLSVLPFAFADTMEPYPVKGASYTSAQVI